MKKALGVFKALSDGTRLKILQALKERESYVELLAERLSLSPATVSFHMKKLMAAGLVDGRKEQYYTIYTLRTEAFQATLGALALEDGQDASAEKLREELYRRKVLKAFIPEGYCEVMPAQIKKRMIVYEEIIRGFEIGKQYPEKEVNQIIERIHGDYCTVRRAFIGLGWMSRDRQNVYTVYDWENTLSAPESSMEGF